MDGAQLVAQANVDGTPSSIVVTQAPDDATRKRALDDAIKIFGQPKRDTRLQTRPYKWGIVQTTDMCGHVVTPTSSP